MTTVKRNKTGGAYIVLSRIYEILKDPVYAGFFYHAGQRYELDKSLPRIITEEEHERIKNILARKNIPKTQHHKTLFSGFINSSEGNFMGQEVKFQLICDCKHKFAHKNKTHCPRCERKIENLENPKYLPYVYYYDVKKKKAKQSYVGVNEKVIKKEFDSFVDQYLNFSEDLVKWSKEYIHELKNVEITNKLLLDQRKEERKLEYEHKKHRTRAMLRDGQITEVEYNDDIDALKKEYMDTTEENKMIDWYSELMDIIDLTESIENIFTNGSYDAKREVLAKLGTNITWNNEKVIINNRKSINKLVDGINQIKCLNQKFEPKNYLANKGLNEKIPLKRDTFSIWLQTVHRFRTFDWKKYENVVGI